jgi:hypothetical protein
MKKSVILAMCSALFLMSCGPSKEDIEKVCGCEDLYVNMRNMEGDYQINDQISSSEAQKKVQNENKEAYDACIKLHNAIGDDNYFKASQKCGAK